MAWQRLSIRDGRKSEPEPYEGVPPHLIDPLTSWIAALFPDNGWGEVTNGQMLRFITTMHEVALKPGVTDHGVRTQLLNCCVTDADLCLDVIDALLQYAAGLENGQVDTTGLRLHLELGRSAWDVAPDNESLVRRTDATATDQGRAAMTPTDVASSELSEAWGKVYGRHPDASDAWDHAIKAVEAILIPIVCPNKNKANLGGVIGDLKSAPHVWDFLLGDVAMLEGMLRLMWPNPDRHQDGTPKRAPTQGEATAIVNLAVTIVQWARAGGLVRG